MNNSSSDSYRNPLRHMGQDYSFAPRYVRPRDPKSPTNASTDIKPKENQGYYPTGSFWTNSVNGNLWVLAKITDNLANWKLLNGSENGTFTPNIAIGGSSTGIIYSFQDANYTKIGNVVNLRIRIVLISKGVSTGIVTLENLPFIVKSNTIAQYIPVNLIIGLTAPGYTSLALQLLAGTTSARFVVSDVSAASPLGTVTDASISNTFQFETNGLYFTD